MAPKRPNPMEDPPAASSSEEEEEEETSSEEGSSTGEEDEDTEPQKPSSPQPLTPSLDKKPAPKKPDLTATTPGPQSSSSESGSESDSDSETEANRRPVGVPDPTVKPIASKPMEETPKTKKPRSKPSASPAKSTAKRPNETDGNLKDSKRAKKKGPEADREDVVAEEDEKKTGEDSKKQLFQRLWSEDDEIVILKGIIDYTAKKGADPSADMNAFHDFIKKSLHVEVTRAQLMDKIRRLRKKYANNLGKGKKGQDRTFSKPHEQKAYDLSKNIWGSEGTSVRGDSVKSNGKATKNQRGNSKTLASLKAELLSSPDGNKEEEKVVVERNSGPERSETQMSLFDKNLGVSGLEEHVLKRGLDLIGEVKKAEMEEKWKKFQVAQLELFVERTELVLEQAKLMLAAHKSSDH